MGSLLTDSETTNIARTEFDDEIDLLELWRALLARKWLIILTTILFAAGSVFYALSLPDMYKSEALLVPAGEADSNSLGRIAGQMGGLVSLTGINFGQGASTKSAEALEILKSWSFIESFINDEGIAAEVYAAESWDKKTGRLKFDENLYDSDSKQWRIDDRTKQSLAPSSWQLYDTFINQYLTISAAKDTGFVIVSIEHYSPSLASSWVRALIKKINHMLQVRDLTESEKNIAFLQEQISSTPIASMQSVLYQLLESQIKTLMLAKGSPEYVFRVVSLAREPEVKSKPNRTLIFTLGTLVGFFLGCLVAVVPRRAVGDAYGY